MKPQFKYEIKINRIKRKITLNFKGQKSDLIFFYFFGPKVSV